MKKQNDETLVKDRFKEEWSNFNNIVLSYGGDGTLLDSIRKYYIDAIKEPKQYFLPVRNYGRCRLHSKVKNVIDWRNRLSVMCDMLYCHINGSKPVYKCVSEIVVKNADPTSCLRIDLSVNSHVIYENILCDGIMASTSVIGSHGYFKSVTRTTFKTGIGLAFINPTYSLVNAILNKYDKISITIRRDCIINLAYDKCLDRVICKAGEIIEISNLKDFVNLIHYDTFMCPYCRSIRNSTIAINDCYVMY